MQLDSLTRDAVKQLTVDRRALEILRAICAGREQPPTGNRRSHRLELEQHHWGTRDLEAARAYEEAFDWLWSHGLVARDPTQDGPDWYFVTERGWHAAQDGLAAMSAARRLDVELHPLIAERVRAQYLLGEYEAAAFLAMRQVEIRVRDLAEASADDIGVPLMKSAFRPGGPLADGNLEAGEQEATMALFWGALGVFKNPSSHRQVEFEDPTLASEVILFADLLLRLLEQRAAE